MEDIRKKRTTLGNQVQARRCEKGEVLKGNSARVPVGAERRGQWSIKKKFWGGDKNAASLTEGDLLS